LIKINTQLRQIALRLRVSLPRWGQAFQEHRPKRALLTKIKDINEGLAVYFWSVADGSILEGRHAQAFPSFGSEHTAHNNRRSPSTVVLSIQGGRHDTSVRHVAYLRSSRNA
jgi:hypothetical protein